MHDRSFSLRYLASYIVFFKKSGAKEITAFD